MKHGLPCVKLQGTLTLQSLCKIPGLLILKAEFLDLVPGHLKRRKTIASYSVIIL